MNKSEIDSIIIDLILEHFNILNLDHKESVFTDNEFDDIVIYAQDVYYKKVMEETPVGIEGEA